MTPVIRPTSSIRPVNRGPCGAGIVMVSRRNGRFVDHALRASDAPNPAGAKSNALQP
jgi:hypothetical protein